MTTHLLDVNVLIALLDSSHAHSAQARAWFRATGMDDWATCPITELGVVRIVSNPAYGGVLEPLPDLIAKLNQLKRMGRHQFWADDLSLHDLNWLRPDRLLSHRQLTDSYLLALAARHGGRLATFDRRIVVDGVVGGAEALAQI